jgi:hypothetical protein
MDDAVLPAKETLDGQPLVLTAQSAEEERGTGGAFDARVVFTHELEPLDPPPGVSPSLVEAAALPAVQLPMGRYPVETSHAGLAFVEIYDRGAIRAVDQTGAGRWFEAATTQSDYIAVFPTQGGRHDRFALMDNGWLRAQTHGAEVETTELLLEAGDRLP